MIFDINLNPDKYIPPLQEVIKRFKLKKGLEIGFCWGMSAYAFLEASKGTLFSLDLDDNKSKESLFRQTYGDRWNIIYGDGPTTCNTLKDKFDYIYIDGEHTYFATRDSLEATLPLLADGGVIVCDDYNQTGVKDAVDEFVKKNKFKLAFLEGHINQAVYLIR